MRANEVPVIDAEDDLDRALIEKYAKRNGRQASSIEFAAAELFRSRPPDGMFDELVVHYERLDIQVKVVSFEPPSMPALLLRDDSERSALRHTSGIPDELRQLFESFHDMRGGFEGSEWTLYLNSANEVVQLMARGETEREVTEQCMKEVYSVAYLVATKGLTVHEVERMARMHSETVAMLLRFARSRSGQGLRDDVPRKILYRIWNRLSNK